jgi:predicted RNA-binding Zn-ribbon protein involved in translation (DUF1610 family)
MNWYIAAFGLAIFVWAAFRLLPKIREALRPRPEDLKFYCPHCGQEHEETRRYCMACGGQIWTNVLSEDVGNK